MGKGITALSIMFLIVCLVGGVVEGNMVTAATSMTAAIDDDDTTISVTSTEGFLDSGIIVIDKEHIAYSSITATSFKGNVARPTKRGVSGTDAEAHADGSVVRMAETAMINGAMGYDIALMADAAGAMAFVTVPLAVFHLLATMSVAPLSFLGTDLQILTAIWALIALGLIVSLFVSLAGGRRV